MRVQPHLPSRPLLAMVTSRSGLALSACSAANRPAPPEPRIKMSVVRRSRLMRTSEHARQQKEGDGDRESGGDGRSLLLSVAPGKVLDHQQPQPAQHVQHEEKYERAFGELHQRLIAPAQEGFERRFAADGKAEGEKMQRQENGERHAGQPVGERGEPKRALAVAQVAQRHGSTTATTARTPSRNSSTPKALASMPAPRS